MKASINEIQLVALLFSAGFLGVFAKWLSGNHPMTFRQYVGRSILNGLTALVAFSINIFYPDADNMAVLGVGLAIMSLGPTSIEMIFQKVFIKK